MTGNRGKDTGFDCPAPDHPVSLGARHGAARGLFLMKSLKKRCIGLKTSFFQIFGQLVLGFVMDRHLAVFAAFLQEPEPAPAAIFLQIIDAHPEHGRDSGKRKKHDADQSPVPQTPLGIRGDRI